MPRAKRGFKARRRRNRILKQAKGFHSARSRLFAYAKEVVMKSWIYAYAHRRLRKNDMVDKSMEKHVKRLLPYS